MSRYAPQTGQFPKWSASVLATPSASKPVIARDDHKSSRMPLNTSASSDGSSQMPRRVDDWRPSQLSAFGIRPLPPHSLHGGGYILRPSCAGCFDAGNPVPSQAGHLCSVGFAGGFFIRTFH
jgi:hypothetical protein